MILIRTNIYKRITSGGKTKWMVRWRIPGKKRWKAMTGGNTKDEAYLVEARVRQELALGNDPSYTKNMSGNSHTVSDIINLFYNHSRFLCGTKNWQIETKARIENHIRPALGNAIFDNIKKDKILKFYLSMRDKNLGRSSIRKTHTLMCLIGDLYQEISGTSENTPRSIKEFSRYFPVTSPKREINFLSYDELELIFKGSLMAENKLLNPLVRFLSFTGLRRSEALDLKWTDIDKKNGFICVRKSKNNKARTIPIEKEAWDAVRSLRNNGEYVFSYLNGTRPHEDSFLKPLKRTAKSAGIKKRIDLHTLRHSYGSNKIRAGWGIKKVSVLLGHSDISITASIYTHLLDGDLKVRDDFLFKDFEQEKAREKENEYISKALANVIEKAAVDSEKNQKNYMAALDERLEKVINFYEEKLSVKNK